MRFMRHSLSLFGVYLRPIQGKYVPSEGLFLLKPCLSNGIEERLMTPAHPLIVDSSVTSSQLCIGLKCPPCSSVLTHGTSHLLPKIIAANTYTQILHARRCSKYFMFIHLFNPLDNPII